MKGMSDDVRHYCHLFLNVNDIVQLVRVCRGWKVIHFSFWSSKLLQEFPSIHVEEKKTSRQMYQKVLQDLQRNPEHLVQHFRDAFHSAEKGMVKQQEGVIEVGQKRFEIQVDRISEMQGRKCGVSPIFKFDLASRRKAYRKVSQSINILSLVEASGMVHLKMPFLNPQVQCIALVGRLLFVQFTSSEVILFDLFKNAQGPLFSFFLDNPMTD
jgi:hypothetical protein